MPKKTKSTSPKTVTRYTYDDIKEPGTPETGHTALMPTDEQIVTLPLDNGWTKALHVGHLSEDDPRPVVVDMDPIIDPVLLWSGKRSQKNIPVLPLQRNEIISESRIAHIIDRVRQSAEQSSPQLSFFADLEKNLRESERGKRVEFFKHEEGWKNKLICGDSLLVMESLIKYENLASKVQMIYIDPPYGVNYNSNFQQKVNKTQNDDNDISDDVITIKAFRDTWALGIHSYLSYLLERLFICRELLADSGSVFMQINDENVHLVRSLMDEVFGRSNFVSQITFQKTGSQETTYLGTTVDYLLWYAKNKASLFYIQPYKKREKGDLSLDRYDHIELPDHSTRRLTADEVRGIDPMPEGRRFRKTSLLSDSETDSPQEFEFQGNVYIPKAGNHWKTTIDGLYRLASLGRIVLEGTTITYKRYADDFNYVPINDRWESMQIGRERDYIVQTAESVITRCILMSTRPGDLVLDITCGSGTTAYCAELFGRRWITCDTSRVSINVTRQRLLSAVFPHFKNRNGSVQSDFVYKTASRIKLEILAKGLEPEVVELVDQPMIDRSAIRICGPIEIMGIGRYSIEDWKGFVTELGKLENYISVLCRLYRKDAAVQGAVGLIHAIAESETEKLAISVGPLTGRVSAKQISDAVEDALSLGILDVHILGWAFEANVGEIKSRLEARGRVQVHLIMIRPDTLAEGLKVTQPEMLFSPLALPDLQLTYQDVAGVHQFVVSLQGVGVFDRKSRSTSYYHADSGYVAAWYLDEDYDGDCFVDSQMFFDFKKAPNLKSLLKLDVDPDEYKLQLSSQPFPLGVYQRVAVKVVDVYGNESTVVKSSGVEAAHVYFVDRVVICDAYLEPEVHYKLLPGGRSRLAPTRRPSMRFLASAREMRGGLDGLVGRQATLFEDMTAADEQQNDFVNALRDEVRDWRNLAYPGTALVTRRLLEYWFERDEERKSLGKRFFFCQREAIETVIYLFEVKTRYKMPETADLLRYALKLATGTGKTVVMALLITWSSLHKRKVSGSSLTENFLVLTPNLTVRDRVSGVPHGDGIDPAGLENLYDAFDIIPPEYKDEFHPNILVRNWQSIPLEAQRDDWIPDDLAEDGRFLPASVLLALQRRARQDPNASIRRLIRNWKDVLIINDEAHHVYGEKKTKAGDESEFIKWNKIIDRIGQVARVRLVIDLSATPWYGSGSPKPDGTLFEWLVSDFSVYDAFESGLVKVVRLPDQTEQGYQYLDLWDSVGAAKNKEEYLSGCKGAIETIYSDWRKDYLEWLGTFEQLRMGPAPVLLVIADRANRAEWLFDHLTKYFELLKNPADDDPRTWVTIRIDSGVFDAEKGNEAILRTMVNTVGKPGMPGENVRCIVSVNMLSEGWDVKSVTHILGLRAFGSPLLTEQIIGRGLRRTNYDVLQQPVAERPEGADETVDAFGIPFVGFPVEKRKRARTGSWGKDLHWIDADKSKERFRLTVPNVQSWAVGVTEPLSQTINIDSLPALTLNPRLIPPDVTVRPPIGGQPEAILTLAEFRQEYPFLKSLFMVAGELFELTNPAETIDQGYGPTFDELLEVASAYLDRRLQVIPPSEKRDVGMYYWRQQVLDILQTPIRGVGVSSATQPIPILGKPEQLDTADLRRFQWTGIVAEGKKCHTSKVPCHTDLERQFADFLDNAKDVLRYFKNERFGFSITYFEKNRPRQYFPDFIVVTRDPAGRETNWVVETKGEIRENTKIKREAADLWCAKMSQTPFGPWQHLFVPQPKFTTSLAYGVTTFADLVKSMNP